MANRKRKQIRKGLVTKTEAEPVSNLVISELNVVTADTSVKDIGNFKKARESAISVYNPNRVALYDLYEDILLDGHLHGIIDKRIKQVVNKKLLYFSPDRQKIDAMDELIKLKAFRKVKKHILWAPMKGNVGLEFIPGKKIEFDEIPEKHIRQDLGLIIKEQYGNTGFPYEENPNIIIIGERKDLGLLLKCAPYAIWKRGVLADWSQFIEIYGQPIRVIYYDAYDGKTKIELKEVLDNTGSSLALMIPKQAQFEIKDGKGTTGDGQLQDRFRNAANEEMSIIVLGNTETTNSSSSSGYAQSKEHGKQQEEIIKDDMDFLLGELNDEKMTNILKSYGWPVVEGGYFVFEEELNLDKLRAQKEIDEFVSSKVPLDDDYYYNAYKRPKPKNYNELKAKMEKDKQARLKPEPEIEDPEEEEEKKAGQKRLIKRTQKPLKKELKGNTFFKLRSLLADFFDPAP